MIVAWWGRHRVRHEQVLISAAIGGVATTSGGVAADKELGDAHLWMQTKRAHEDCSTRGYIYEGDAHAKRRASVAHIAQCGGQVLNMGEALVHAAHGCAEQTLLAKWPLTALRVLIVEGTHKASDRISSHEDAAPAQHGSGPQRLDVNLVDA